MKKLALISIVAVLLFSCEKEYPFIYQIYNHNYLGEADSINFDPYLDGTMYETEVTCFNEQGEVIRTDKLGTLATKGNSGSIALTPEMVRLKISFRMLPNESEKFNSDFNTRKYTAEYFDLWANVNIIIVNEYMVFQESLE